MDQEYIEIVINNLEEYAKSIVKNHARGCLLCGMYNPNISCEEYYTCKESHQKKIMQKLYLIVNLLKKIQQLGDSVDEVLDIAIETITQT